MSETEIAELAAKRLLGTMKKYTHQIFLKREDVKPIIIEHDESLTVRIVDGVEGAVLCLGYNGKLLVRMSDVLLYLTTENPTNE